ncbi:hypothetical protein LIY46_00040 [Fusobacterium varium]|uniref:hypothetical protein n=1 Tax=Fusobacterium TaxID=848 RepID=UPI001032906D|nr:hypothetical protein [Fusobacterium ulcerans]
MNVKLRMIGDKLDARYILVNAAKLQLGTTIYTEKFPITKDIGILTILDNFSENKNKFQICVKSSDGTVIGKGEIFRSKVVLKGQQEGIIIYNINNAYFENRNNFYVVELWNENNLLDTFELRCESNIYNIYENLDEKGTISLI